MLELWLVLPVPDALSVLARTVWILASLGRAISANRLTCRTSYMADTSSNTATVVLASERM